MQILAKLFGSAARVRLLRLFLFNPGAVYTLESASERSLTGKAIVRRELSMLSSIGFLKPRSGYVERKGKGGKVTRKRAPGFTLDESFPYLSVLQRLLLNTSGKLEELERRIVKQAKPKVVILSGVLVDDWEDGRLDLLIAVDKVNRSLFERSIRAVEAELGKELRYALFTTAELKYRLSVYDKLVRDVLDYPHRVLVNKTGLNL